MFPLTKNRNWLIYLFTLVLRSVTVKFLTTIDFKKEKVPQLMKCVVRLKIVAEGGFH